MQIRLHHSFVYTIQGFRYPIERSVSKSLEGFEQIGLAFCDPMRESALSLTNRDMPVVSASATVLQAVLTFSTSTISL